jgi:hypothetical protein
MGMVFISGLWAQKGKVDHVRDVPPVHPCMEQGWLTGLGAWTREWNTTLEWSSPWEPGMTHTSKRAVLHTFIARKILALSGWVNSAHAASMLRGTTPTSRTHAEYPGADVTVMFLSLLLPNVSVSGTSMRGLGILSHYTTCCCSRLSALRLIPCPSGRMRIKLRLTLPMGHSVCQVEPGFVCIKHLNDRLLQNLRCIASASTGPWHRSNGCNANLHPNIAGLH